ncbi:MAG TPA: hypothetical protein VKJ47_24495 [Candidatus Binatia bacterium]|nr:hypothetical protein [Candidatus Binatia bacterium]
MEETLQASKSEAAASLKVLRRRIRWKPGKAAAHLKKRKALGHLPAETSVEEYNRLIQALVQEAEHQVYLYRFGSERYYAVRGMIGRTEWLVISTKEGAVETAFPPDVMDDYLSKRGFVPVGTIREVSA